jgi:hypothetical protein
LDAWKHDLQKKYSARLAQAMTALGTGEVAR